MSSDVSAPGGGGADYRLANAVLQSVLRLNAVETVDLSALLQLVLDEALSLTDSSLGFIGTLSDDESVMTLHAWSREAMAQCQVRDMPWHFPVAQAGIWAEAVRQRRPVTVNAAAEGRPAGRLPAGHVRLDRHLGYPVCDDGRVVMMLMVGNKRAAYGNRDTEALHLLSAGSWRLLRQRRSDTERQQLQAQLAERGRLEAVGRLAAGIAHEINNPVQFIGDNLSFLRDVQVGLSAALARAAVTDRAAAALPAVLAGAPPMPAPVSEALAHLDTCQREFAAAAAEADLPYLCEEIPRAVEQSLQGIARIGSIVASLKQFSHADGPDRAVVDVNAVVRMATDVCRNEWKFIANLDLALDPELPSVMGYPNELRQVMLNLVVNAAQAISERQRMDSVRGLIVVATRVKADRVEIAVSDDGTGIADQDLPHVFEPFFTTRPVGQGTGQGLALAWNVVVRRHGGTIEISTEIGRGSTFTVSLPVAKIAIRNKG